MVQLSPPAVRLPSAELQDQLLGIRIHRALQSTGHVQLRHVRVIAREGHVELQGCLPTFYLKQMAQTAALRVPGVRTLENELVVG